MGCKNMKYIGPHVSIAGGIFNAPINAVNLSAKAFALFTKNQRQWSAAPLTIEEITHFKTELVKTGIQPKYVLPHGSYLINLGSPDQAARAKSVAALIDEMERTAQLGLIQLNIHPGCHKNLVSEAECLALIADSINQAFVATPKIKILIENTSGQGSCVGYKFEHLARIIEQVAEKSRLGVCIDTCHLFASGYDLRDKSAYKQTWNEFAAIIGFEYLHGMHVNDCKTEFGSRVDRHASIGKGNLGLNAFKLIMQDSRMDEMPLILETPEPESWAEEIKLLYQL